MSLIKTYTFSTFNYVDADIGISTNTIFFRGIDKKLDNDNDIIRPGVPMFMGPEYIAKEYGHVYRLRPSRNLRLLDFRRLKNLMRLVVSARKKMTSDVVWNRFIESVRLITIAFGLCSYAGQIDLMEKHVASIEADVLDVKELDFIKSRIENMKLTDTKHVLNPFEPEGVRIAETQIDRKVMFILKELFGDVYDGYIAQKMYSPFHVQNASHEEILIFDPVKSGIVLFNDNDVTIPVMPISKVFTGYKIFELEGDSFKRTIILSGGGKRKNKNIDRNTMFDDAVKVKEAITEAKFFTSRINYKISDIGVLPKFDLKLNDISFLQKPDDCIGDC